MQFPMRVCPAPAVGSFSAASTRAWPEEEMRMEPAYPDHSKRRRRASTWRFFQSTMLGPKSGPKKLKGGPRRRFPTQCHRARSKRSSVFCKRKAEKPPAWLKPPPVWRGSFNWYRCLQNRKRPLPLILVYTQRIWLSNIKAWPVISKPSFMWIRQLA